MNMCHLPFIVHVGMELQLPFARQVTKESPDSVYPTSQLIMATSPYVVPTGVCAVPFAVIGESQSGEECLGDYKRVM